eukprot:2988995-Pleurochrysis_carterae.AAC.1
MREQLKASAISRAPPRGQDVRRISSQAAEPDDDCGTVQREVLAFELDRTISAVLSAMRQGVQTDPAMQSGAHDTTEAETVLLSEFADEAKVDKKAQQAEEEAAEHGNNQLEHESTVPARQDDVHAADAAGGGPDCTQFCSCGCDDAGVGEGAENREGGDGVDGVDAAIFDVCAAGGEVTAEGSDLNGPDQGCLSSLDSLEVRVCIAALMDQDGPVAAVSIGLRTEGLSTTEGEAEAEAVDSTAAALSTENAWAEEAAVGEAEAAEETEAVAAVPVSDRACLSNVAFSEARVKIAALFDNNGAAAVVSILIAAEPGQGEPEGEPEARGATMEEEEVKVEAAAAVATRAAAEEIMEPAAVMEIEEAEAIALEPDDSSPSNVGSTQVRVKISATC